MADLVDEAAESDDEIPDPPEPIENGIIDLGRLATDALLPRRSIPIRASRMRFSSRWLTAADPEDHPFAALKALQGRAETVRREEAQRQVSRLLKWMIRPYSG